MIENQQLIQTFYASFKNKDYKTMQQCYANDVIFNDAVFTNLNATQVKAMWQMFCINGKDMMVDFSNIKATETTGSAEWVATYVFSTTGKKVVNKITANFVFENGKIVKHTDTFSFYNWAKQALGLTGMLLGWTIFIKTKVKKTALKTLSNYMNEIAMY